MSDITRIISQLMPRHERLPTPTGVAGRAVPVDTKPIMLPGMNVLDNPRVLAALDIGNPNSPRHVRADAMRRFEDMLLAINEYLHSQMRVTGIRFYTEERANRVVAVIRDVNSGEVLKVMPTSAILEIAARLRQASGILVDTTL